MLKNIKKLFFAIIFVITSATVLIAENSVDNIKKEQLLSLLNYIQFSTIKIKTYQNKVVADREFNFIINQIKRDCIFDSSIRDSYDNLLRTLTKVKLNDMEKEFYNSQVEFERANAINQSFQSFGSVFIPGITPQQIIASLAYTGVSAFFNYKNAINSVNSSFNKNIFKIEKSNIEAIDDQRTDFFSKSSNILTQYNLDEKQFSYENHMIGFINNLDVENNAKIRALSHPDLIKRFNNFPPFWFELRSAYQELGDEKKAQECYAKFEKIKKHSVINYDKYYVELAKNMISIYSGKSTNIEEKIKTMKKNKNIINKYLAIIEKETCPMPISNRADSNYYVAQIYYLLGNIDTAIKKLEENVIFKNQAPEYVDNSLNLLKIIKTSTKDDELYTALAQCENIEFGTENLHKLYDNKRGYIKENIEIDPSYYDKEFLNIILNYYSKKKYFNDEYICFTVPEYLHKNYNIKKIYIGENKEFSSPMIIKFYDNKNNKYVYWIKYKWEIKKENQLFTILFKSRINNKKVREFEVFYDLYQVYDDYVFNGKMGLEQIYNNTFHNVNGERTWIFGLNLNKQKFKFKTYKEMQKQAKKEIKKVSSEYNKTPEKIQIKFNEIYTNYIKSLKDVLNESKIEINNYYGNKVPYSSKIFKISDKGNWYSNIFTSPANYCVTNIRAITKENNPYSKVEYVFDELLNLKAFKVGHRLQIMNLSEIFNDVYEIESIEIKENEKN